MANKAIKICGIFRKEDVIIVNKYLPEYIGFVFAKSPRQITRAKAKELKSIVDPSIKVIGVFVDATIDTIMEIVEDGSIDGIQLHGKEDHQYIHALKKRTSLPIFKAVSLTKDTVLDEDVDYYIFDGKNPGSGQCFDWTMIKESKKPFFLAGGISLDNLHEAMEIDSYGIDVSSGVETNGYKEEVKIAALIGGIRNGKR